MGYYKKAEAPKINETLAEKLEEDVEKIEKEVVQAEEEMVATVDKEKMEMLNSTLFMYGYDHVQNSYIKIDELLKNNIADIKLYSGRSSMTLEECPKILNDEISKEMSMLLKGLLYCAPSKFTQQIVTNGEVRLQIEECSNSRCRSNKAKLKNVIFTTGVISQKIVFSEVLGQYELTNSIQAL